MNQTCAFFGHRDICTDICVPLEVQIRRVVTEFGVSTFWCGGMGAFDMFAASAVKHLQTEFPHLRLLLVLAYLPAQSAEIHDIYDGSLYP